MDLKMATFVNSALYFLFVSFQKLTSNLLHIILKKYEKKKKDLTPKIAFNSF